MARTPSRRELTLVGVLGAAVLVWLIFGGAEEAPQTVAARKAQERAITYSKAPVVHMELLAKDEVSYDAKGRDVFKYAPRPPSKVAVAEMKRGAW